MVQLYISDPVCSIVRAGIELKEFKRVSLESSETKTVKFNITANMLSFTDIEYKRVVEAGEFNVRIGSNCKDTKNVTIVIEHISNINDLDK